jgi:hypothetical protein
MKRTARTIASFALALGLALTLGAGPAQARVCEDGRSSTGPMWLSFLHPGLGEYALQGYGSWSKMPQRKFWLGFIPFYGWPGYLQIKSMVDVNNCRTNDWLTFRE